MASFVLATTERTNLANTLKTDLAGGLLKLYTAAYATLLVSIPLAAIPGTVANGVLTLDCTNMAANAAAAGNAAAGRFFKSDGITQVADCDVGASGSGATIQLDNVNIAAGQSVGITSGAITVPAGV